MKSRIQISEFLARSFFLWHFLNHQLRSEYNEVSKFNCMKDVVILAMHLKINLLIETEQNHENVAALNKANKMFRSLELN